MAGHNQVPWESEGERSVPIDAVLSRFNRMVRSVGGKHGLTDPEQDELIQEVRIRLWRALEDPARIREVATSYVYQTATTAALDMVRRKSSGRAARVETPEVSEAVLERKSGGWRADHRVKHGEISRQIEDALAALAENRRPVVKMYLAGYDRHEIAELLGWTEGKTRNLLYRGLADLRAALTALGVSPEDM